MYKINIHFKNNTSPHISLKANKIALIKFKKKKKEKKNQLSSYVT